MEQKLARIKELIKILNDASKAYYQEDREIMSNLEYDALYDELVALEKETGTVYANSPTVQVGYELLSELVKERHSSPMLSLDKTKDVGNLKDWLGAQEGILSWKLDGLTIVLTYENGVLQKAVTRGNGEIGEVITNNAKTFVNLPKQISYTGKMVLRGEAVIKYSDFEKINAEIEDVESKYKNPRNLCSGSVRQLNNEITAKRNVHFFAFSLVEAEGVDFKNSIEQQLLFLKQQGFEVVEYQRVTKDTIEEVVLWFSEHIAQNDFPSDGLVLIYDDISYGKNLGRTAKFPRDSIAFKWADELAKTTLTEIEWSPSRTGLINPVAIFEPVELEGTTVSRASLHNISIVENLKLGIGDCITVYKANMIIPQVAENLTKSGKIAIPEHCPACGGKTKIQDVNGVRSLYCTNEFCSAKKIKLFSHFVSRDAMNIDGLSEMTLNKFIEQGFLKELYDLFSLEQYKEQILELEGFGQRSYDKLIESIQKARMTTLPRFIYSLGIPNIGLSNAKMICKQYQYQLEPLKKATVEELVCIDGIGEVIAKSICDYFENEHNEKVITALLKEITIEEPIKEQNLELKMEGLTFVITGSVERFKNRNEVKAVIEELGGKVTGSVTSKTNYLINNDNTSSSSKNKKAKELGIPIITEEEFINQFQITI